MPTLYYAPGAASFAPHLLLREIGAPFDLIRVDLRAGEQKSGAYLKLNPNGRIPTYVDGDLVLWESAAICLHLADRHPDSGLAPALGTPERAHFTKWLIWLTNTLQPALLTMMHLVRNGMPEALVDEVKPAAFRMVGNHLQVLDAYLAAGGPYILGERPTAADLYFFMLARWSLYRDPPARITGYPNARALFERLAARPAVQRTLDAEGLVLPPLDPVAA